MGSALTGSLQISCFFDRGFFWVLPLTYVYLPKSARAYLFPQSIKIVYFCSGPVSAAVLTPVVRNQALRNQVRARAQHHGRGPREGARQRGLQGRGGSLLRLQRFSGPETGKRKRVTRKADGKLTLLVNLVRVNFWRKWAG